MAVDHSSTYREWRLKNLPHRFRLNEIKKVVGDLAANMGSISYLDVGCSNGYITRQIVELIDPAVA